MLIYHPLTELSLSLNNVRKTPNEVAHRELCASLLHHGLQQNLVVVQEEDQRHAVIAGGRRLKGLQTLHEQGLLVPNIGDDWMIPCQMMHAVNATELSLVENTIRIAMHPADQFMAWRALIEAGSSIADVASRFGVSETLVRQRLKLAKVSLPLMQAYRDGQMDLEDLMAFTLCDDEARQMHVWQQLKDLHHFSPQQIRRLLTDGAVCSTSKLALFVGEEAYEQAGGRITHDLFQEVCYFENAALLESLALSALHAKATALRTQWSFVDARLDADYGVMRDYVQLDASMCSVPEALRQNMAIKTARYDALTHSTYEDEDADEEALQQEYATLELELETLQEAVQPYLNYTDEQKRISWCFLWINHDGTLELREAMQHVTSHRPALTHSAEASTDAPPHAVFDTTPAASDYSSSLKEDLSIYRTQMLQVAIAGDFTAAFDLMTFALCMKHLRDPHAYMASALSISVDPFRTTTSQKDGEDTTLGKALTTLRVALSVDFLSLADEVSRFKAFCVLPEMEKHKLFAYVVAQSVQGGLKGQMHPALEMVATRLDVHAHELWRPTEANFFKRIKKAAASHHYH
jgi:ParB family transcriptional regulator, chromosome partitioning protein